MKILITGGAGFIGSNLVHFVLRARPGWEVTNLDALTYAGSLANLEALDGHPDHRFVRGDICDGFLVRDLLRDQDAVLNLAAESHVDRSIQEAAPFVRTNVVGTHVLLDAARDAGVSRFLQVSTDEVYGELSWVDPERASAVAAKFREDTPLQPRSPYAASKAAADLLVQSYHITHGMNTVVARGSNNYGPHQHPEKLIPLMVTRALDREVLPVYGDGLNIRDWMHVDDFSRGILAVLEGGRPGEVYNFGGGAERTNLQVVRSILRALDLSEEQVTFVDDRPGHDRRYAMDFSKATEELGWVPLRAFDEGLAATVEWYKKNRGRWAVSE
jgi:dTDP-glucose 4,6-dehydratase